MEHYKIERNTEKAKDLKKRKIVIKNRPHENQRSENLKNRKIKNRETEKLEEIAKSKN